MGNLHTIRRLEFRGRAGEAPAFRRSFAEGFAYEVSTSGGLSADAVLCVRKMAMTMRRSSGRRLRDHSIRDALAAEVAGAAWPARGAVPAGANAVIFAYAAEMLASLAQDWCAGEGARWWWAALFPHGDLGETVRRLWLQEARAAPAALELLEEKGACRRFLERLAPATVSALWLGITQAFALVEVEFAGVARTAPAPAQSSEFAAAPGAPARPCWARWVAEAPELAEPARRLRVLALMLMRAPDIVRSRAFAESLDRVDEHAAGQEDEAPANVVKDSTATSSSHASTSESASAPQREHAPVEGRAPASSDSAGVGGLSEESTSHPPRDSAAQVPDLESAARPPSTPPPQLVADEPSTATEDLPVAGVSESASASAVTNPEAPRAESGSWARRTAIRTAYGGVFYLVNVALALEYYTDFARPRGANLALPLWDFLALLGGHFTGDALSADPLPALLARLANRDEGQPPSAGFEPPEGASLAGWLARTAERISTRLALAPGIAGVPDWRPLVLAQDASIAASATHVDVHFSLAAHPIGLRLAGLDRDPGWVPAAGRTITFHYE